MKTLFTKQDPLETINEAHDLEWTRTLQSKPMTKEQFERILTAYLYLYLLKGVKIK